MSIVTSRGFQEFFRSSDNCVALSEQSEFAKAVIDSMEQLMFLKRINDEQLMLYPAIGKLAGKYPKEYEEQRRENSKENQKGEDEE